MSTQEYPEHEKLSRVRDQSQAIGEFLDWMDDRGIHRAEWVEGSDQLWPSMRTINDLLAEYFGIDQDKLEAEKVSMLEMQREMA